MNTSLRLDPELEERLSILSKKTECSKSFLIRKALKNYIADMEDYYDSLAVLERTDPKRHLEEIL